MFKKTVSGKLTAACQGRMANRLQQRCRHLPGLWPGGSKRKADKRKTWPRLLALPNCAHFGMHFQIALPGHALRRARTACQPTPKRALPTRRHQKQERI